MTNVTRSGDDVRFHDHFSAVADRYARHRPTYPPALYAWLAGLPPRPRRAWDCATGNGQAAVALAEHFAEVRATDLSAEQLSRAEPHPRVTYTEAAAEESGLPDGWADLVTVAQAVHWFDRERFWRQADRVLAPGGAVAAWCYELFATEAAVVAVVERLYRQVVGDYWPPERHSIELGYEDLRPGFEAVFEPIGVPDFEMAADWDLHRVRGYLSTWSASRRWSAAHGGADPVALVDEELADAWGPAERTRRLTWPLTVLAGRKT